MSAEPVRMSARTNFGRLLPGLLLTLAIAATAWLFTKLSGQIFFTPLLLSVLAGIVIGNCFVLPEATRAGIVFTSRVLLRFAIVLLGFQLSFAQITGIGIGSLLIVAAVVTTSFVVTSWLGAILGVNAKLAALIAAGTSVCGASAVVSMSTVTASDDEDVVYAVAIVTIFGTILMFLLPAIAHATDFVSRDFAIWAGASIHEIAQVTGAGFQFSQEAGESAVVVKLARVLMLAPLILCVSLWLRRRSVTPADNVQAPVFPSFVLGFLVAAAVSSMVSLPVLVQQGLMTLTSFMLSMALAAFGLQTTLQNLKTKGMRPLALGAAATIFIVCLSYALIRLVY